ncbi:MAG: hypothetical protein ISS66_07535 [Desulfobacteraceae bacterium]|nr:hypothetical protein [Desulfobacteraceae bacterium]
MNETNVLLYIPVIGEANEKIQGVIDKVSPDAKREIIETIEDLSRRLCRPVDRPTIAILAAENKEDLLNIISIRHLLSEIPIILILPDREESTTAMGYTLWPRFLTYVDSNSSELVAVLGKMFDKYGKEVMEEWHNIWKS